MKEKHVKSRTKKSEGSIMSQDQVAISLPRLSMSRDNFFLCLITSRSHFCNVTSFFAVFRFRTSTCELYILKTSMVTYTLTSTNRFGIQISILCQFFLIFSYSSSAPSSVDCDNWTEKMTFSPIHVSLYKKWHKIRNFNSKLRKNEDGDPILFI